MQLWSNSSQLSDLITTNLGLGILNVTDLGMETNLVALNDPFTHTMKDWTGEFP